MAIGDRRFTNKIDGKEFEELNPEKKLIQLFVTL